MIAVDTRGAERLLVGVLRQFPFAVANSLNRVAFHFRDVQRDAMRSRFIIRRPWVLQGVQVPTGAKATKDKARVTIEVEQQREFLAKFERGGIKRPRDGRSLAVPEDDTFSRTRVVPQGKRPRALQLKQGAGGRVEGLQRTFLIETKSGARAIFQRTGPLKKASAGKRRRRKGAGSAPGSRDRRVRLLWWLPARGQIGADLRFEVTARRVFASSFRTFFNEELARALRTARL